MKKRKRKQEKTIGKQWRNGAAMDSHVIILWGVSMVLPETEAANLSSYDMDKSIVMGNFRNF